MIIFRVTLLCLAALATSAAAANGTAVSAVGGDTADTAQSEPVLQPWDWEDDDDGNDRRRGSPARVTMHKLIDNIHSYCKAKYNKTPKPAPTHTYTGGSDPSTGTGESVPTAIPVTGGVAETLAKLNQFRASQGVSALTFHSEGVACAKQSAVYDAAHGFHASFYGKICSPAPRSQCECMGTQTANQCLMLFIQEGPGGGHYEIIRSAQYTSVAIANDGAGFYTFNFY